MDNADLAHRFTYHAPKDNQIARYGLIREYASLFAYKLNRWCPDSREKSLAITHLEEAVVWANASIARGEADRVEQSWKSRLQTECDELSERVEKLQSYLDKPTEINNESFQRLKEQLVLMKGYRDILLQRIILDV